ncbi:hypothetical protein ACHAXT_009867 [Thalassiosira profunda]
MLLLALLSFLAAASGAPRPIAIVTGGTRGIGSGIARALAAEYDLLVTYNTNREAAVEFALALLDEDPRGERRVEVTGGDLSQEATRDDIFSALDSMVGEGGQCSGGRLAVLVHNAGQYVGITSDNSEGLEGGKPLSFGDGSLVGEDGRTNFQTMNYYHKLYGEAFIDLCERSLLRMGEGGGSIIGISSPPVNAHYYSPQGSYSMQGAGKSLMEYSARIYALKAAERNINVNIIVPGYTASEAWGRLAKRRGMDDEMEMLNNLVEQRMPLKRPAAPRDIGNVVKFLCTDSAKFLTGLVIPVDGGLHLK